MNLEEFNLTSQLAALWRRKWIIVLVMLVVGGTAWAFTPSQPLFYKATATLMIQGQQDSTSILAMVAGTMGTPDIASQMEVMRSRSVLERAIRKLDPAQAADPQYLQARAEELQRSLNITQVKGTALIELSIASLDPAKAQQEADAVAEAYVYEANRAGMATAQAALENVNLQLQELRQSKVDLSLSPSLPRAMAQMNTALRAIETASASLGQLPGQLPEQPTSSPAADTDSGTANSPGTTITESQRLMITQQTNAAKANADELSRLLGQPGLSASEGDAARSTISEQLAAAKSSADGISALIHQMGQQMASAEAVPVPTPAVRDAGTTLNEQQRGMIQKLVDAALENAEDLSTLIQVLENQLQVGVRLRDVDIAAVETHAQAMAAGLAPLADELEKMRQAETDQQLRGQLLTSAANLRMAQSSATAIAQQSVVLYDQATATLLSRVSEYSVTLSASLKDTSEQVHRMLPRAPGMLPDKIVAAGATLKDADIAAVEMQCQAVVTALAPITEEIVKMRQAETDQQAMGLLLTTEATLKAAQSAAAALSAQAPVLYVDANSRQVSRMAEYSATLSASLKDATDQFRQVSSSKQGALPNSPAGVPSGLQDADIAAIEMRAQSVATGLAPIADEVEKMRQAEIDQQARGLLLTAEAKLRAAQSAASAVTTQTSVLYTQGGARLVPRMAEYAATIAASLQDASDQLKLTQPRKGATAAGKQGAAETGVPLTRSQVSGYSARVSAVSASLRDLSLKFQPPAAGSAQQSIVLDYAELAAVETTVQTAGSTLGSLREELGKMQAAKTDSAVSGQLVAVNEQMKIASDAVDRLPDLVKDLSESAISSPRYVALDSLRGKLEVSMLGVDSQAIRVGDKALISAPAIDPWQRNKNGMLGAFAGVLLATLGILTLERFDRRVRNDRRATDCAGMPLLARIPTTKGMGNPGRPSVLQQGALGFLESFRLLRTALETDSGKGKVLLVTSPAGNEGKTTVAANLARVARLQGRKTLLVDGNLQKPDVAKTFGVAAKEPAGTQHEGARTPDPKASANGVDILTCRALSSDSEEVLSSDEVAKSLREAREKYDVIIVDSSSVAGCADAQILARQADAAIMVVEANASNVDQVRDSKLALEATGVKVVGCVLNKVGPKVGKQKK